jgi:hypothetical protein
MNQVWYVRDPSEEKRYSRIYYRNVYSKMENA